MKKILFITTTLLVIVLMACDKHDLPTVIAPVINDIKVNSTVDIGFEIITDAGYHSSDVSAEAGNATHITDIGQGAVQGLIYIKYTAGSETGTDYITFIVYDLEGNQGFSKVKIEIVESN